MTADCRRQRSIYPWAVCLACLLIIICTVGLVSTAFSIYLPFVKEALRLTNTQTSMIHTVRCLVTTVSMLFTTQLYRRFSLRAGIALGGIMLAVSCLIFMSAQHAAQCYLAAVFMGIAYGIGSLIPVSILMRNWFVNYQSTAIALASMGSSVALGILPPVITALVLRFGLSATFFTEFVFVLICVAIFLVIARDTPEQMGKTPYRSGTERGGRQKPHGLHTTLTKTEVLLMYAAMFLVGWAGTPYAVHLSVHYDTVGFSPAMIAAAMSVNGIVMACAKMLFGTSSDRLGTRVVNYLFMGVFIISSFMLGTLHAGGSGMFFSSAALGGAGVMMGSLGATVWCTDLSAAGEYPVRIKYAQALFSFGGLTGSPIPGIIADHTGSYRPVYLIYGVVLLLVLLIIQCLYYRHTEDSRKKVMKKKECVKWKN